MQITNLAIKTKTFYDQTELMRLKLKIVPQTLLTLQLIKNVNAA